MSEILELAAYSLLGFGAAYFGTGVGMALYGLQNPRGEPCIFKQVKMAMVSSRK